MMIVCSGLFVGYCYDLDYRLIWYGSISSRKIYFGDQFRHLVGQVRPNWAFPVQPHLPFWGGPNLVHYYASRRCLQLGKVIRVRYPDQVGRYKSCVPVVVGPFVLVWNSFVFPRRWPLDVQSSIGDTLHWVQRGVGRSGQESVMAVDWFCRNAVGPPEWEYEAMGSVM